jgi:hypothetical protein
MWSSPRDEDAPRLRFKADVMNDDNNGAILITPRPARVRVQDGLIRHGGVFTTSQRSSTAYFAGTKHISRHEGIL